VTIFVFLPIYFSLFPDFVNPSNVAFTTSLNQSRITVYFTHGSNNGLKPININSPSAKQENFICKQELKSKFTNFIEIIKHLLPKKNLTRYNIPKTCSSSKHRDANAIYTFLPPSIPKPNLNILATKKKNITITHISLKISLNHWPTFNPTPSLTLIICLHHKNVLIPPLP
jgi:hypothetical protein